ncbi:acyl carrier protein [Streptomyces tubercidicus]|uniref:acyl carrier protein n=1 Tax=Streptomyces tubercidicus TaxID=47759 RepID=UPI00369D1F47
MTSSLADQDLLATIAELLQEIAEVPVEDVKSEARFRDDLDVDSLLMVEFGVAIEDSFGVSIPDEEFSKLYTVGSLVAFIEQAKG